MTDIKVIPTLYRGIRFRSRTEARWAVFFDHLEVPFEYEPEGYRLHCCPYLPDFLIRPWSTFVEIKGKQPTREERLKCQELAYVTSMKVMLMEGPPSSGRGELFSRDIFGDEIHTFNASFALCRRCAVPTISYYTQDGCGFGNASVVPCGSDDGCIDKFTPQLLGLEAAIQASANHRFDKHRRRAS